MKVARIGASGMDFVTGGCGFIGRKVVMALRERGRIVRVFDRRPWNDGWNGALGDGLEFVQGTILDQKSVIESMKGCERVFHLAANPNLWASDPQEFDRVNYQGTKIVIDAAKIVKPERFIYTSTESILKSKHRDPRASRIEIDESARLTLGDMPGPYCRSKFLAEEYAQKAYEIDGLPVVIVNPTMPLGPEDELLTPPTRMILGFLNGSTPAYLNCEFNIVDARDAALGHVLAAERGKMGERYILGGENVLLPDLLQLLAEITHLPMPRFSIPYPLALASAVINEIISYFTKQPPIAPLTGVRLARTSMAFDCSKARSELGWEPRPLRDTLLDSIRWLEGRNYLKRPLQA